MGAKYIPSIKDIKANQRFQQKQKPAPKPAKPAVQSTAKPETSKGEKP